MRPDTGELGWQGVSRTFANPRTAQDAGIVTVFQETLVVPELSVRDNIFFGTDGMLRLGRSRQDEISEATHALQELGIGELGLDRPAWSLSLAERQLVTIARAIVRSWRLLILDEGTSALDANQRDRLFAYLQQARSEGKSVLFTSHRMDEVFGLADRITVLRTGRTVVTAAINEVSQQEVLAQMSGRERAEALLTDVTVAERVAARQDADDELQQPVVLRVEDLRLRPDAAMINLELRRGEILGIAGLEGQGQVEFVECLCGLQRPTSGRVLRTRDDGQSAAIHSYRDANRRGIRYVRCGEISIGSEC